ncbi:MAG TPA: matrixin family metalloprotease [Candidatus Paceibacterota bacterium]|nr:matrixin family metalloprotease [Candidatus Paceibacterota bacterium]
MKGDIIRWTILAAILVIAGGGIYFKYQHTRSCAQSIRYAIGAVDARFDISSAALLNDSEAAAAIWNKAGGRPLLVYDKNSAFKINLIYDARQASAKIGIQIATQQSKEDAARAELDAAQAQFIAEQSAYNQTVSASNARGGATPSEIIAFNAQRAALNVLSDSINQKVAIYNASVDALNAVVANYNKSAGQTFKEGEYVQDASGKRINIFEFVGTTQLERVLAHEFGHSLGLGHNSNPQSIMYAQNESGNLIPTTDDLSALRAICDS